jgi:hypothetical protein
MRSLPAVFHCFAIVAAAVSLGLSGCASSEPPRKKRPPLPGEEVSDLSWSRPTGPNDIGTPMGLPLSR